MTSLLFIAKNPTEGGLLEARDADDATHWKWELKIESVCILMLYCTHIIIHTYIHVPSDHPKLVPTACMELAHA